MVDGEQIPDQPQPAKPRKPAKPRDPSLPPRITRGGDKRGRKRQPLSDSRSLRGMQTMRAPDYLIIGQIVCDIMPDGTGVLGGTALYSGLTAARLGARVGILTRGRYGETIDGVAVPSLEPYSDQITIITQEAESPTFFVNEYMGSRRTQTIRRWAGAIDLRGLPPHWANAEIIHLGPVAREIDTHQVLSLSPGFLGMTPQGWMREWPMERGGRVRHVPLRLPPELLARTDAIVVSDEEIAQARAAVTSVGQQRIGVVTLGPNGCNLLYGGHKADLPGYPVKTVDLTGAGDVFAAAFFTRAADRSISPVAAGRFANLVAALSLRGIGPDAIPPMAEIEQRYAEWEKETRG
ncbi:MAG: PfkB family carbohydrate kinase [Thermomicrobiales bacterium]